MLTIPIQSNFIKANILLDGILYNPIEVNFVLWENMPIGFFDCELVGDKLYLHNLQLSEDYQKGTGTQILGLMEQVARDYGAKAIIGKVFSERSKIINWLQRYGYKLDIKIEQENSYYVRRELRRIQ